MGRSVAVATVIIFLASPIRANAQGDDQLAFSRVSGNAYGTVFDPCGVTQTAVAISAFGTTSVRNASNATTSVVIYRFDNCRGSSFFAYGSSHECDFFINTVNGKQLPESVTVSGQVSLHEYASSGNRVGTVPFKLTLRLVGPTLANSDESDSSVMTGRGRRNEGYDYNVDATGAITLSNGLQSMPLRNGQIKFER